MRREFKIHCSDVSVQPSTLARLFHFGRTESELAAALCVDVATVGRWKDGTEPVPALCVRYLELLDAGSVLKNAGPWNGSHVVGTRLHVDCGYQLSIEFEELERLSEYRRLYHLHQLQTDLIERLLTERNFYRDQCHRQARFGMVINSLFYD